MSDTASSIGGSSYRGSDLRGAEQTGRLRGHGISPRASGLITAGAVVVILGVLATMGLTIAGAAGAGPFKGTPVGGTAGLLGAEVLVIGMMGAVIREAQKAKAPPPSQQKLERATNFPGGPRSPDEIDFGALDAWDQGLVSFEESAAWARAFEPDDTGSEPASPPTTPDPTDQPPVSNSDEAAQTTVAEAQPAPYETPTASAGGTAQPGVTLFQGIKLQGPTQGEDTRAALQRHGLNLNELEDLYENQWGLVRQQLQVTGNVTEEMIKAVSPPLQKQSDSDQKLLQNLLILRDALPPKDPVRAQLKDLADIALVRVQEWGASAALERIAQPRPYEEAPTVESYGADLQKLRASYETDRGAVNQALVEHELEVPVQGDSPEKDLDALIKLKDKLTARGEQTLSTQLNGLVANLTAQTGLSAGQKTFV